MLVFEATKKEFLDSVYNDTIVKGITDIYQKKIGKPNPKEVTSWKNSMQYMYKVLDKSKIPNDCGIAIEFRIPLTASRIDFIISGYDKNNIGSIIIIELKQWEKAKKVEDKDGIVKTFLGGGEHETTHPSYQAWSYYKLISDFNSAIHEGKINIKPCAYLHNYNKIYENEITDEIYLHLVKLAPLYLQGDAEKLKKFIEENIYYGDNRKNIYEIDSGKLKPSKSLQDSLDKMIQGNPEFTMIDSQKVIFEDILYLGLKTQKDNKKRVYIVEGGPGTGKSVLAVNLVANFIKNNIYSTYISKNASPRNVYAEKLKGVKTDYIKHLFSGSGSYHKTPKNYFPTLIVDEAHRLNEKSGLFKNIGENQIKEIINATKFSVFFIDENQRVDINDIGTISRIRKFAKELKAEIYEMKLESQFRCNGSDGYLAWLDHTLEIRDTANYDGFDFDYDIQIIDNPNELRKKIEEKNTRNKARIVAGYCWDWIYSGRTKSDIYDIIIDNFKMSWNLSNTNTWAIDEGSINEVGCIHTCQGLEFDYIGVIIGLDMRYENGKIVTDYTKRAKTDKSLSGIKKIAKENPKEAEKIADEIIKNTYRTLMTRGMKGCYVYCCDPGLNRYLKEKIKNIKKINLFFP